MNKEIVIRSINSAVDFAVLHDGKLIELHKEKDNNKFNVGDIFIAKVKKTISGLNAAFVNVGYEKDGFLHQHIRKKMEILSCDKGLAKEQYVQ